MKSGFTLIELLIVMVIVGILVTIALPKYNASLERARAQEGIANLKAASDIMNAHYVMNGNAYPADGEGVLNTLGTHYVERSQFITGDFVKSKYFSQPQGNVTNSRSASVSVIRKEGSDSLYSLVASLSDGEILHIYCTPGSEGQESPNAHYCEEIGGEWSAFLGQWDLQQ